MSAFALVAVFVLGLALPAWAADVMGVSPEVAASPSPTPDPVTQREMQVHFLIATEHYKEGNYKAAIAEWQEVLKIQPDHALAKEKIKRAKEKI